MSKKTNWGWEDPELIDWEDSYPDAASRMHESRCLPLVAVALAASYPFVCSPRRYCYPRRWYYSGYCRPYYSCSPIFLCIPLGYRY
ncbi:hypothetical protein SCACP_21100 [Sporomusa carbonis]|uniref:hypothetical protein n=1 Tax=Sporomusa carbonis TaxID=3076075 RepID=UPI003A67BB41